MDDDNAKRIFPQIVEGIQYIHSLQVGHRDLKCENILLDKNKKVKVGEWNKIIFRNMWLKLKKYRKLIPVG